MTNDPNPREDDERDDTPEPRKDERREERREETETVVTKTEPDTDDDEARE